MLLYFYGLLLVSRASGHIVDCSDFCATYWDLPLVQERLQGEAGMGMGLGFPEYQVCTRFSFDRDKLMNLKFTLLHGNLECIAQVQIFEL